MQLRIVTYVESNVSAASGKFFWGAAESRIAIGAQWRIWNWTIFLSRVSLICSDSNTSSVSFNPFVVMSLTTDHLLVQSSLALDTHASKSSSNVVDGRISHPQAPFTELAACDFIDRSFIESLVWLGFVGVSHKECLENFPTFFLYHVRPFSHYLQSNQARRSLQNKSTEWILYKKFQSLM